MAYINYKKNKKWRDANFIWKRKTLEGVTSELQKDGAPSHIARNSIAYLRRENVFCIEQDMFSNNQTLNRLDYAFERPAGASQRRQEVWHRWSVEAGDRAGVTRTCHGASLITASGNGNVVVDHNVGHIEHTFH